MYSAMTEGIEVSVEPAYASERSSPDNSAFFWHYTVEIRNTGQEVVQLRARHWEITDATGKVQHVRGLGVVGEQPVLAPGEHFRYTSGCALTTSTGIMGGSYEMISREGRRFEVVIPAFSLDVPFEPRSLN